VHGLLQTNPDDAASWLSPDEIALVRTQFAFIQLDADAFATVFYDAFFSITPVVRTLFRSDMPQHRETFMRMLAMLVSKLHASNSMAAPLAELGRRHFGYGVLALDYDCFGEALMRALASHLGMAFDARARAAWSKAYVSIVSGMRSART
jgi:hemoglobin-like flavoprotein